MAFENGVVPKYWRSAELFHCTRVKERGLNVRTIKVLTCSVWLVKYMCRDLSR